MPKRIAITVAIAILWLLLLAPLNPYTQWWLLPFGSGVAYCIIREWKTAPVSEKAVMVIACLVAVIVKLRTPNLGYLSFILEQLLFFSPLLILPIWGVVALIKVIFRRILLPIYFEEEERRSQTKD